METDFELGWNDRMNTRAMQTADKYAGNFPAYRVGYRAADREILQYKNSVPIKVRAKCR